MIKPNKWFWGPLRSFLSPKLVKKRKKAKSVLLRNKMIQYNIITSLYTIVFGFNFDLRAKALGTRWGLFLFFWGGGF